MKRTIATPFTLLICHLKFNTSYSRHLIVHEKHHFDFQEPFRLVEAAGTANAMLCSCWVLLH